MKKIIALILVCMFALTGMAMAEKLTLATNVAFPPYEFYDDDGNEAGIDIEIAQAICEKLGYELEVKDISFDAIIAGVATGKYDFSMAGMTVTDERKESVLFSDTYASAKQVVIVAEGSEVDLDKLYEGGYKIGVQMGTTGDIYTTGDFEDTGLCTVERYKTGVDAVEALKVGKVDCVVIDNEPAKAFVEANEGLVILETAYAEEDYAACFALDNTELQQAFNTALAELVADGTIDAIIGKYISAE